MKQIYPKRIHKAIALFLLRLFSTPFDGNTLLTSNVANLPITCMIKDNNNELNSNEIVSKFLNE